MIKRCPTCDLENPLPQIVCERCGVSLVSVIPTLQKPSRTDTDTEQPALQNASHTCPECGQGNPAHADRCVYCDASMREARASDANGSEYRLHWPWGARPIKGQLHVGREHPTPPDLIKQLVNHGFDNISRRHALFEATPDGLYLTDLGSANGTYIDGVRIQANRRVRLTDGADIRLASNLSAKLEVIKDR